MSVTATAVMRARVWTACAALVWMASSSAIAATLPAGFVESLVAGGLANPTAMAIAPDGRVFVCLQGGQLRVIKDGSLLSAPFVSLSVNAQHERGLLGVALDPAFDTNGFVYVYYTTATAPIHNRVSRFTASQDVAVPGSEVVLLDLEPLGATNHNGGAIHFGPDGTLYVAVGDNAVGGNAQVLTNRLGKVLRINADGSIPPDNPFNAVATGVNQAIWALGLRNPFTFAFDPGTGRLLINDVGERAWEEINDGVAGANYGWPDTEGPTTDPRFAPPLSAYDRRGTGDCAIAGGAFYRPLVSSFPAEYVGTYFFADFCGGWIRRLDPDTAAVQGFAEAIVRPVDLAVAGDGSLYYLARGPGGTTGSLFRIVHVTDVANLRVSALTAPARALPHAVIRLSDTTKNDGPGDASESETGFWLSVDTKLGNDAWLGARTVPAVPGGASSRGSVQVSLPAVVPGTYYLIAQADVTGAVVESDEIRNLRTRKLLIGPDIKSTVATTPANPSSTAPTTITVTTTNAGVGTTALSLTRLFLSVNGSIGAGDILLAEFHVPALVSKQSTVQEVAVTLPPGTFYLIVRGDATGAVAEANESNNAGKAKKTIP